MKTINITLEPREAQRILEEHLKAKVLRGEVRVVNITTCPSSDSTPAPGVPYNGLSLEVLHDPTLNPQP